MLALSSHVTYRTLRFCGFLHQRKRGWPTAIPRSVGVAVRELNDKR